MVTKLDQKLYESFRRVKNDMMRLQERMNSLSQNQEKILEFAQKNRERQVALDKRLQTAVARTGKASAKSASAAGPAPRRRAKKVFVASKEGTKFHTENCPFAKNIRPKSRLTFHSKAKALNSGLKPCTCVVKI